MLRNRVLPGLPRRGVLPLAAVGLLATCAARAAPPPGLDESKLPPPAQVKIVFARDIKPIFTNICFRCHSGDRPKSHFLLTSRESALKGGSEGVDIVPGKSGESPLIYYVSRLVPDMEMPPEGKGPPLTKEQVGLLRAWIDQGAVWEKTEPEVKLQGVASPTVGWTTVKGDEKKFRELYWQREGWNGGLEAFELTDKPTQDSRITASGHVLLNDYKLTFSAEKNDLGFTRFGWTQYRKYFDDSGGYFPALTPPIFDLNQDLYLDIGRAWVDLGLTLPRWPRLVLGYEYQYRDGTEATTQWGPVSSATQPNGVSIYPAWKDISEHVHILKFDVDYETDTARVSDSFRGEWYSLGTARQNDAWYQLDTAAMATTAATEKETHFRGANAFHLEKQLTDWWFASGGYLYSHLDSDAAVDVTTAIPATLTAPLGAPGWSGDGIELERDSHVFSISTLFGPWEGLSLSLGSQNEWTRQTGLGTANVTFALPGFPIIQVGPEDFFSDYDRSTFTQEAGLRFTKIPFTTLFVEGRLQQEYIGQTQDIEGGLTPYLLQTDAKSRLQDFRGGFNTSPWRRVMLSAQYRYYDNRSDYPNTYKAPAGVAGEGYPGFILSRDLASQEAEGKASLQLAPWLKTTFGYKWLDNRYHTTTDAVTDPLSGLAGGVTPGGSLLASTYRANIATLNATLTPWQRLFLSTTFAYQNARTVTTANDSPSVAPYEGDIYSVIASGSYALNAKTDLTASYSFSFADFGPQSLADGLPLGMKYQQHALQLGLRRRIAKGTTLGLRYSFYHYDEPTSGGFNDFNAQAVFATLTFAMR